MYIRYGRYILPFVERVLGLFLSILGIPISWCCCMRLLLIYVWFLNFSVLRHQPQIVGRQFHVAVSRWSLERSTKGCLDVSESSKRYLRTDIIPENAQLAAKRLFPSAICIPLSSDVLKEGKVRCNKFGQRFWEAFCWCTWPLALTQLKVPKYIFRCAIGGANRLWLNQT